MSEEHITIGDISPRIQYAADGVQTVFTFPFPIFGAADLEVWLDTALQAAGYTVTGAGDAAGGSVAFDTAPAAGTTVTLRRSLAIRRTTDFQEGGAFRAKTINDELDRQTAFIQDVAEEVGRAIRLPATAVAADLALPDPQPSALIGWNAAGDGLENRDMAGFTGPAGPEGPAGADGADGADGIFSGVEPSVPPALDDLAAILDADDAGNPKFATLRTMLALVAALDELDPADGANDVLLVYDASAGAVKKVRPANLGIGTAVSWASIDAASNPAVLQAGANVLSVTRNGTGQWTVQWDKPFASADYAVNTAFRSAAHSVGEYLYVAGKTISSVDLEFRGTSAATLQNPAEIYVAAFGAQ